MCTDDYDMFIAIHSNTKLATTTLHLYTSYADHAYNPEYSMLEYVTDTIIIAQMTF